MSTPPNARYGSAQARSGKPSRRPRRSIALLFRPVPRRMLGVPASCYRAVSAGCLAPSGLAVNDVTRVEVVGLDGTPRIVDHDHEPDVFWALRGGGGEFGVVTGVE